MSPGAPVFTLAVIGLQIIGPVCGDLRTIGLAQWLERMGFAFRAPLGFD